MNRSDQYSLERPTGEFLKLKTKGRINLPFVFYIFTEILCPTFKSYANNHF
jgi:hypothetical protein